MKWHGLGLDALICPAYHHCAFKNEDAPILSYSTENLVMWNLLNFPAGTLPVTNVLKSEADAQYNDGYDDTKTKAVRNSIKGS